MKLYQYKDAKERILGINLQLKRSSELPDMEKMNPTQKTGGKSDGLRLVGGERKGEMQ